MIAVLVGLGLLFAASGFALCRGGAPERLSAVFMIVCWVGDVAVRLACRSAGMWADLGSDAALATGFLFLAWRYQQLWVALVLILQGTILSLHGLQMADAGVSAPVYRWAINVDSYLLLALLVTATAVPRVRAGGGPAAHASAVTRREDGFTPPARGRRA